MADWLNYFFGGAKAKTEPTKNIPAEPLSAFPSKEDARYALEQGFGYGSGNEPYIEGKRAQIYAQPSRLGDRDTTIIGAPTVNTDLTQFRNLAELGKIRAIHARTALAANRNPIAALGYNPQRLGLQTQNNPTNVGGMYDPDQDRSWVNVANQNETSRPPSTPVHESIHRGLEQMQRVDESWMGEKDRALAEEARVLRKKFPDDEEYLVRHIMNSQMGNPEQGRGEEADRLRKKAVDYFFSDKEYFGGKRHEDLARMQEIAAEQRKNRRPGGPR